MSIDKKRAMDFVVGMVLGLSLSAGAATVVIETNMAKTLAKDREIRESYAAAESNWKAGIAELNQALLECRKAAAPAPAPSSSQFRAEQPTSDDPLTMLNVVRPGLGDLAVKVRQAHDAGQCPPGSRPETSEFWQGYKCVAAGVQ